MSTKYDVFKCNCRLDDRDFYECDYCEKLRTVDTPVELEVGEFSLIVIIIGFAIYKAVEYFL